MATSPEDFGGLSEVRLALTSSGNLGRPPPAGVEPDSGPEDQTGWQCAASELERCLTHYQVSAADLAMGELVERARPPALRDFDQIPMQRADLLRQARAMAPLLAEQSVAFVGDSDGTSLVLGLIAMHGGPRPANMHLLDFDLRLLANALSFADEHGFGGLLEVRPYNVFDPVPEDLVGRCDWFYLNPPYGSRNAGLSARLFIGRGMELVRQGSGRGCAILPSDPQRPWTQRAWRRTERFLRDHAWVAEEKIDGVHRYHLVDDPGLTSSTILVRRSRGTDVPDPPFQGRRVGAREIRNFYGRAVKPPFPRYIRKDGTRDFDWGTLEAAAA